MGERPRVNKNLIATTSSNQSKRNVAYKQRHDFIEKTASSKPGKDGMPRYYVRIFGKCEEIPESQVTVYEQGGFVVRRFYKSISFIGSRPYFEK